MKDKRSVLSQTRTSRPRIIRVLGLWDLVFYGIVLVQPIAPIPLFGIAQSLSNGHFVTNLLLALVPMMITAYSYGRMAAIYPSAGSAYAYVSQGVNVYLGFFVGWAMLLDYILMPLVNGIWVAVAIHSRYFPKIPYSLAMLLVVGVMTIPNLKGVKTSARTDKMLLVAMCSITVAFILLAIRFLFHNQGWAGLLSTEPFYSPKGLNLHTMWTATSYAALAYVGFDGVTTLAEDVKNPRRNVLAAILLVCLFTGIFGGIQAYLGQRVWRDWRTLPNLETAFMDVCQRVGGRFLFHAMGLTILLAELGGGLAAILGAARLLFSMGRDNVLPRKVFAHLSRNTNAPTYSILIIGGIAFFGAMALQYVGNAFEHAGELLNFGAFFTFMSVNFAAFWQFSFVQPRGSKAWMFADSILSLCGATFCGIIWWNLDLIAKIVGGIWFLVGGLYLAISTYGFRQPPQVIKFGEET